MTNQQTKPKIAIYVEGGMVQAIRSNISPELEIEVVDADLINDDEDNDRSANEWWEHLQEELEFGNY